MRRKGSGALSKHTNGLEPIQIMITCKLLEEQKFFADFVNQILSITKSEDYAENPQKQAKVKALEAEIDQLVYKLCDLTSEEIKIVEGNGLKTKEKKAKLQKHINSEVT